MKEGIEALNAITDKILAYGPSKKNVSKKARPPKKSRKRPVKRAKKLKP